MVCDFDEKHYLSFSSQYISQTRHPPMGIYSHGNKNHSHSHSHTDCFPFLPISIPNFVINSHSHEITIPIGNPIPMVISSLMLPLGKYQRVMILPFAKLL